MFYSILHNMCIGQNVYLKLRTLGKYYSFKNISVHFGFFKYVFFYILIYSWFSKNKITFSPHDLWILVYKWKYRNNTESILCGEYVKMVTWLVTAAIIIHLLLLNLPLWLSATFRHAFRIPTSQLSSCCLISAVHKDPMQAGTLLIWNTSDMKKIHRGYMKYSRTHHQEFIISYLPPQHNHNIEGYIIYSLPIHIFIFPHLYLFMKLLNLWWGYILKNSSQIENIIIKNEFNTSNSPNIIT